MHASRTGLVWTALAVAVLVLVGAAFLVVQGRRDRAAGVAKDAAVGRAIQQLRSGLRMWDDQGYPSPELVTKSGLCSPSLDPFLRMRHWPANPFTGKPMHAGREPGDYEYTPLEGQGHGGAAGFGAAGYRLVGFGRDGRAVIVTGESWDSAVELAIDDIGTAVKAWAVAHNGSCPAPAVVNSVGLVGYFKGKWSGGHWPTNPYDGEPMHAGSALGDYQYELAGGGRGFDLKGRGGGGWYSYSDGWHMAS